MKNRKTAYQRVQLDGKWYVIIEEEEFMELTENGSSNDKLDVLDAINVTDQRLANRLLQRRQETGLSQKELASLAEIRVETLNRIEKGRTTADFKTIRKLVNAINKYNDTRKEFHHDNKNR